MAAPTFESRDKYIIRLFLCTGEDKVSSSLCFTYCVNLSADASTLLRRWHIFLIYMYIYIYIYVKISRLIALNDDHWLTKKILDEGSLQMFRSYVSSSAAGPPTTEQLLSSGRALHPTRSVFRPLLIHQRADKLQYSLCVVHWLRCIVYPSTLRQPGPC